MFGNIYRQVSRYIPQQKTLWFRFKNRVTDERGHDHNLYHEPTEIYGNWQAIETEDTQSMGFDSSSIYRRFYTSHNIKGIRRSTSPDYLVFNGKKYEVTGEMDWYEQDGWKSVVCIEVGAYDR